MGILVIAEHDNQGMKPVNLSVISAASQLGKDITVLVVGTQCQDVAAAASQISGVSKVILVDNPCYQHHLAENLTQLIHELADGYQFILAAATTFGKNLMPRLAALLDVGMISDITEIIDAETFIRPIYAGNALATIKSHDTQKLITIRPTAFDNIFKAQPDAEILTLDKPIESRSSVFVSKQLNQSERPELTNAKVIVSGGRGLQNKDNFAMIEALADKLGAAVGASRAAVDAGFVPNDYQVGQTGKVVAPELYIAIGISGAIQHVAGMKDSKVIVAINKDQDAPIFKIADYGLVGDLFEIIPELQEKL